jgi:predicted RecA/RadA family phage recombinase
MATNRVHQDGRKLSLAVGSGVVSGDPVVVGQMAGVALTDYSSVSGEATLDMGGVYDLSVKAVDNSGNVAVAIGDALYHVDGDTPKLSKKASGVFFGYALEAITSGQTATIKVRIPGMGGDGGGGYHGEGVFISDEQTGDGSSQTIAHDLGAAPVKVLIIPTEFASNISYDATEGTHTSTNVVATVTSGAKYRVMAFK